MEQTKLDVNELRRGFAHFVWVQKKKMQMNDRRKALSEVKEQVDREESKLSEQERKIKI